MILIRIMVAMTTMMTLTMMMLMTIMMMMMTLLMTIMMMMMTVLMTKYGLVVGYSVVGYSYICIKLATSLHCTFYTASQFYITQFYS